MVYSKNLNHHIISATMYIIIINYFDFLKIIKKMANNDNRMIPVRVTSVYMIYYDTGNRKVRCAGINANTWNIIHKLYTGEQDCCMINGTMLMIHNGDILTRGKIKNLVDFTTFTNRIICAHHKPVKENEPFIIEKTSCNCWETLTSATTHKEKENVFLREGTYAYINGLR